MVGKAAVWAHWGSWDFTKKYVFDNYNSKSAQLISEELNTNVTIIENYIKELEEIKTRAKTSNIREQDLINQWFAPYPSFAGQQSCNMQNATIVCQNGLQIDLFSGQILNKDSFSSVKFKNLIYPGSSGKLEVIEQDEQGNVDIIFSSFTKSI